MMSSDSNKPPNSKLAGELVPLIKATLPTNPLTDIPDASDPFVDDLRLLGKELVAEARLLLRRGSPAIRTRLVQSVVPELIKAASKGVDTESQEIRVMRIQLDALHAMIRAGIGVSPNTPSPDRVIPEDNAH